jgi:hypothetical membrane protein
MLRTGRRQYFGALAWTCCFQFFVAEQITSRAWQTRYSFTRNYISDLGELGSPLHAWMNASFVLQGFLICTGVFLLWTGYKRLDEIGLQLLTASGLGVLVVGSAPSDISPLLHKVAAATHFLSGGLGICLLGLAALDKNRALASLSIASGLIVLGATAMLGVLETRQSAGLVERAGAYGITLWLVANGLIYLVRVNSRGEDPA